MARIRSVKPEYWLDRKLARGASRDARLLYIGLWNYADEHARLHGDPSVIKGEVFPYDDDLMPDQIEKLLLELAHLGRIHLYDFEGDPYIFLPNLPKHQRLEPQKAKSRLPDPPERPDPPPHGHKPSPGEDSEKTVAESEPCADESAPIVAQQVAGSRLHEAGSREHVAGGRGAGDGGGKPPAAKRGTTIPDNFHVTDQHRQWAIQKVPGINPDDEIDHFINHHQAKGSTMKNWDAAFRTWLHNARKWSPAARAARPNPLAEKRRNAFSVISNTADPDRRLEIS